MFRKIRLDLILLDMVFGKVRSEIIVFEFFKNHFNISLLNDLFGELSLRNYTVKFGLCCVSVNV